MSGDFRGFLNAGWCFQNQEQLVLGVLVTSSMSESIKMMGSRVLPK